MRLAPLDPDDISKCVGYMLGCLSTGPEADNIARKVGGHLRGSVGTELSPTRLVGHVTQYSAPFKFSAVRTISVLFLLYGTFPYHHCVELPRPVDHFPVLRALLRPFFASGTFSNQGVLLDRRCIHFFIRLRLWRL